MSAMLVASENDTWTPETILNRGLKMLEFLCEFIQVDYSELSEAMKYKLLGLEFMLEKAPIADLDK